MNTIGFSNQPSAVRFGKAANTAEYQEIQSYLTAQGLPGEKLDPACTEVTRKSPVPVWNFLRNTLVDLPSQFGFVRRMKQKSAEANGELPYAAVLTRYNSSKHAQVVYGLVQKQFAKKAPGGEMQAFQPKPDELLLVFRPDRLDKKA